MLRRPPDPSATPWRYPKSMVAQEVTRVGRFCDRVIQWRPLPHDDGALLAMVDVPRKEVAEGRLPELGDEDALILLNGNLNHHQDIQALLEELRPQLRRSSRVAVVAYNPYLRPLYDVANTLRLRHGEKPYTFVSKVDLRNLAKLSGFEITRFRPVALSPARLAGGEALLNGLLPMVPGVRELALCHVVILRPLVMTEVAKPSLSVIIPARNERGNIEAALHRLQAFGKEVDLEVVFVEGHSDDGTWEEIQRVLPLYEKRFRLRALQQTGKGKADAVRLGFSQATGDLLTILDADLTMPPEKLHRFYDAYCEGKADFVNGSRLVYPMEGEAMRFLNRLGNIFFAKTLSAILGTRIGDSLCGTKLMRRRDYQRFVAWRERFGDVDPFGDFELLFPAAALGLGIVDVPVRYRDRTYGQTNISRFRHGAQLAAMTLRGVRKIAGGSWR